MEKTKLKDFLVATGDEYMKTCIRCNKDFSTSQASRLTCNECLLKSKKEKEENE